MSLIARLLLGALLLPTFVMAMAVGVSIGKHLAYQEQVDYHRKGELSPTVSAKFREIAQ